jgi:hypothetical protein
MKCGCTLIFTLCASTSALADVCGSIECESQAEPKPKYYVDLAWKSAGGMLNSLRLAEELTSEPGAESIPLFLHGYDTKIFDRKNYTQNRQLVDLARRLDSEGRIELIGCDLALQWWLERPETFDPAFDLVPYVPGAINELWKQGYRPLQQGNTLKKP